MITTLRICVVLMPLLVLLVGWQSRPVTPRRPAGAVTRLRTEWGRAARGRVAWVVGGLLAWSVGGWVLLLIVGAAGQWTRRLLPRKRRQARRHRLLHELPEVVDFYRVALGGGLTPLAATEVVARRLDGVIPAALAHRVSRVALGASFADELETLPDGVGEEVRGLSRVLMSTERHGVPAAPALDQLGAEVRMERRREAEIAARRLPVKLLFPLVACTLPAFVLLTVVPIVVTSFQSIATP